jgi:hypothetical protein
VGSSKGVKNAYDPPPSKRRIFLFPLPCGPEWRHPKWAHLDDEPPDDLNIGDRDPRPPDEPQDQRGCYEHACQFTVILQSKHGSEGVMGGVDMRHPVNGWADSGQSEYKNLPPSSRPPGARGLAQASLQNDPALITGAETRADSGVGPVK